jgi:hypothetical protein
VATVSLAVCLAVAAALLLVGRVPLTKAAEEGDRPTAAPATRTPGQPAPPDVDLRQIRDVFRYADEPRLDESAASVSARPSLTPDEEAPPPPSRTRLVGLVRKGGRQAAALSIDGEVVVLGEGDSSSGFTVLAVDDDSVTLRDPEGVDEVLSLP